MKNINNTGDCITRWIRWIARIWSFPIIAYSLIMLAGYTWNWVTIGKADPYAVEGYPFVEVLPPIFTFLSVLGLGIAWSWEGLGGAITLVFNIATFLLLLIQRPITHEFSRLAIPYIISTVIVIPGILFMVCWWRSKKRLTLRK